MNQDTLLLLPLDERPINVAYPPLLAALLGWRVLIPRELLGHRKRPAQVEAIPSWLHEHFGDAMAAIVSIDTLAWGGLIPSRLSHATSDDARDNLQVLHELRARYPSKPILGFSSIQRVSRDDDDGEEPPYYRTHGRAIFRRSALEHMSEFGVLDDVTRGELDRLRHEVPAPAWDDFTSRRARNHSVNVAAIDLAQTGVLDFLVLNQDDTTEWGLNVQERATLENEVRRRDLGRRVMVYPGADEVAQVLIARLASTVHRQRPRFATVFASRNGASIRTDYEDRPLGDLVVTHVRAANGVMAPAHERPDVMLAVNSPSIAQGHGYLQLAPRYAVDATITAAERAFIERTQARVRGLDRSLEAFVDTIGLMLDGDQRVSLADVAHSNGADDELMSLLAHGGHLQSLCGYGGWNTAGNALGSAVALGAIATMTSPTAERSAAINARLIDDWLYQTRVRTRLMVDPAWHRFGFAELIPHADLPNLLKRILDGLGEACVEHDLPWTVSHVELPWRRLFEIDYALTPAAERYRVHGTG